MRFRNTTILSSERLWEMFLRGIEGWPLDDLDISVRYSRGADFSGVCFYRPPRIFVNLGRENSYPYFLRTHIARAESDKNSWWRELYTVELADEYELVLFVFLHEFYHYLVRRARRNTRQKEAKCDRFAARVLVDQYGADDSRSGGQAMSRDAWDFQDLDGFVAAARRPDTACL